MSLNNLLVRNSLLVYLNLFVTSILGLFATRYLLNYLGVSDYGLYAIVGSIVVFINFFNTVMVSTTHRYIAFEFGRNNGRDVNKVFNISLSIHLLMIVFLLILSETLGIWYIRNYINIEPSKLKDAIFVFRFSVWSAVFGIISVPYQGFITAMEKFKVRVIIDILKASISLLVVIYIGMLNIDRLRVYSALIAAIALVTSLLYVFICRNYYNEYVKLNLQRDVYKYKEMLGFSGWTAIGAAAYVGRDTGSQLVLNLFFGTVLNASFGIASMINSFIKLFANNLSQVAIPQITKSHSSGDNVKTLKLVTYVSKYSFLLICIPAIPILVSTEFILKFWLGYVPKYSVEFCQLMILNAIVDSLFAGVPAAVQASGSIKWFQIISSGIMLVSLPVSYFFLKINQPPFVIIIIFISTAIVNIFIGLYLLERILNFNVSYFIKNALQRGLYVIICFLPLLYFTSLFDSSSFARFFILSIVALTWVFFVIFYVGLEKKERSMIKNYFVKIKKNSAINEW